MSLNINSFIHSFSGLDRPISLKAGGVVSAWPKLVIPKLITNKTILPTDLLGKTPFLFLDLFENYDPGDPCDDLLGQMDDDLLFPTGNPGANLDVDSPGLHKIISCFF